MEKSVFMLFVFGQAQKGVLCRPTLCRSAQELFQTFGHPPEETQGILFALRAVLLNQMCIFFRVKEEGFSVQDYLLGLHILKSQWDHIQLQAIGLPGVGDIQLIEQTEIICHKKKTLLVINEQDLFDFLSNR